MTYLGLILLWLCHFLPASLRHLLGRALGGALYAGAPRRRRIAARNMQLCFPGQNPAERAALIRAHFRALGEAVLDWGVLWWGSPARIRRLVRIEGLENLDACRGQPVILVAPHFVGMDAGGIRLTQEQRLATLYMRPKQPAFDRVLRAGRSRFNNALVLSREEGMRPLLLALRAGTPLYFLPDLDHGVQHGVFAPFFNVPAATLTSVARLARATGARVLTCYTRRTGAGYTISISRPWADFPSGDEAADARRLNLEVEACVRQAPAEYWWLHRRFKTRPEGEPDPYA